MGLPWAGGAIANVEWRGVWLSDVLEAAGLRERAAGGQWQVVEGAAGVWGGGERRCTTSTTRSCSTAKRP